MSDDFGSLADILTGLESSDPSRRYEAAHRAHKFAEATVDALFRAIARPENRNYSGTLIYVLQAFRCETRFTELFDLALYANYEVQHHALSILYGQAFTVTKQQIRDAELALAGLAERENLTARDVERLRADLQHVLSRLGASASRDA